MLPEWFSWEFWAETARAIWAEYVANRENIISLATLLAGVIGIPLLAIRTFAANRSARASLEQAKTAAERHDVSKRGADRERRITENFAKAVEGAASTLSRRFRGPTNQGPLQG